MHLSDFDYELPEERIAQQAAEPRDSSRLLVLDPVEQTMEEKIFHEIVEELGENDVLVLNKTKVIPARLQGYFYNHAQEKKSCEVFLHKELSLDSWDCLVYPGKKLKVGKKVFFENSTLEAEIIAISESGRIVQFSKAGIEFLTEIETIGAMPLPPYIKNNAQEKNRYQTVFSEVTGSVAAPTAGLHFTENLLNTLEKKGVQIEKVLLHVGLGTFKGVETEDITEHRMHKEYIELSESAAKRLNEAKKNGKRIISVGTTSIRVLESFCENGELKAGSMETGIFIYPGYEWKFVDAIITNFHLPKSTLLMLVSSFAGRAFILEAYKYAVENTFRFFSYGDAMFIKKRA